MRLFESDVPQLAEAEQSISAGESELPARQGRSMIAAAYLAYRHAFRIGSRIQSNETLRSVSAQTSEELWALCTKLARDSGWGDIKEPKFIYRPDKNKKPGIRARPRSFGEAPPRPNPNPAMQVRSL